MALQRTLNFSSKAVLALGAALALHACGSPDPSRRDAAARAGAEPAEGWTEVHMLSWGAYVDLDIAGHFKTSYNACRQEEWGVVELDDWNIIARSVNQIVKSQAQMLAEERCFPTPDTPRALDGFAEVKLQEGSNRKVALFDARGRTTCTKIPDAQMAEQLLGALNRVLFESAYEGCQEARPSPRPASRAP